MNGKQYHLLIMDKAHLLSVISDQAVTKWRSLAPTFTEGSGIGSKRGGELLHV